MITTTLEEQNLKQLNTSSSVKCKVGLTKEEEEAILEDKNNVVILKSKASFERSNNACIPPSKRKQLSQESGSMFHQKENWEQLREAINGIMNRLNESNIKDLIENLYSNANLLRRRGLLLKNIPKAITVNLSYSHIKEEYLDVFQYDTDFEKNKLIWRKIRDEILGNGNDYQPEILLITKRTVEYCL